MVPKGDDVVAPQGVSTCRSKGPEDVWIERTYDYVVASGSLKGTSHRWRWWKILSQDHMNSVFSCQKREREREKEVKEWNEQKLPKVLPGYS